MPTGELTVRLHARIAEIDPVSWDALDDTAHPFTRHAFLQALEATDSLRTDAGWIPRHVALWRGDELVAAAPAYLKLNSHGEFVFDHAWANAAMRAGIDYFPKLLVAVPYSPVNGPRLLARDSESRKLLASQLERAAELLDCSSVHVNFLHSKVECDALDQNGYIERCDVQFHWRNQSGWRDWQDFSASLTSRRRKTIRQERDRLARSGWTFERLEGDRITGTILDEAHALYARTFAEKYNHAALTREFFSHLHADMPGTLMIVRARSPANAVAMALCLQSRDTLFGRYWGSEVDAPGLHFEACYYQGIEHCLATGRTLFEPGAQGEHKLARGFLPSLTASRHLLRDPRLHAAVAEAMQRERLQVTQYRDELMAHSPFSEAPTCS